MKKVLVAMSGGVDSSAAAALLLEQGYECSGATMRLFSDNESDVSDAAAVCDTLKIKHLTFDLSELFGREVIDSFVTAYENGKTPNPCIVCNKKLKFGALLDKALELGFDCIATGHYARIGFDADSGRYLLRKAAFTEKDQSYVLYGLTQQQLARTLFPLGGMTKEQVRAAAEERGFVNARKHDSQDICFIPDGDYASFIIGRTGKSYPSGNFTDTSGKPLGRHSGLIRYTIGQRRGLGISLGERAYVCGIDPKANTVTLGKNSDLFSDTAEISSLNLISVTELTEPLRAAVKIRYSHREQPALITQTGKDTALIRFDEPQRAITKGQSAVIYSGDTVVGGGEIV